MNEGKRARLIGHHICKSYLYQKMCNHHKDISMRNFKYQTLQRSLCSTIRKCHHILLPWSLCYEGYITRTMLWGPCHTDNVVRAMSYGSCCKGQVMRTILEDHVIKITPRGASYIFTDARSYICHQTWINQTIRRISVSRHRHPKLDDVRD